jgi:ATP-binding cassette subfamily B multidrug efflux pump
MCCSCRCASSTAPSPAQLVSRVTNDTEAVKTLYVQVLFVMLDSVIMLAGHAGGHGLLDWRLMLIVALLVPAVFGIVWLYQRLSAPAVTRSRALRSDINAQAAESIAGMAVVQASGRAGRFAQRFAATNEAHYRGAPATSCAPTPGCCGRRSTC